jgi:hypothetical protein
MRPSTKTRVLAALVAVLLGLNLIDAGTGERLRETLPTIEAVSRENATRIELSSATSKTVLTAIPVADAAPGEDPVRWELTAPITGPADQQAVKALLASFRKEVPLDVRVDEGNLSDYGLDPGNGVVVEIWREDQAEPAVSFTVGFDSPGGSSFLRLSGDDAVYRARVGGRHRYDRKPAEWRNRVLLDFDEYLVAALQVDVSDETRTRLVRGDSPGVDTDGLPLPGPWQLDPDPGWPTDQLLADAIGSSLGSMRAGELLGADFEGGFDPPVATISVELATGETRAVEVGSRTVEGAAFVRIVGEPDVYRVASATIRQALSSPVELRDKTLMRFSRQNVDTMAYQEGRSTILLQQDLATGSWNVLQPDNIDLDVKLVYFAINTMATLRSDEVVEGVSLTQAGLDEPQARIVLRFLDGHNEGLEIGRPMQDERGRTYFYVKAGGSDQIHLLREPVVAKLKAGFGRG